MKDSISEVELLRFKWPPKMPSFRFRRSNDSSTLWMAYVYPNDTLVTANSNPIAKFLFETENEARSWKQKTEKSLGKPMVIISEIYGGDEDGWMDI